ncbi:phosphoribosylglycinamide formyltransferase [Falsibacillus albus]|uniref:Phosphoribosylglycinamide formyltransferase n=1 Tax=Falsibacillus albus TaxID=2478915 RepID=A0A3L7JKM7_9BACI|nr:phosphoribosylglycinamide formyltransferase [Falsibacillus albus]RLQ90669.1 phosphoribosylglycinamide formyltransferase [Falsibacillus albus]
MKLAVFASGSGSNFQSIVNAIHEGRLDASVEVLICDKPDAFVIERATKENIPYFAFQAKEYENKTAYERVIIEKLEEHGIDFIALAGYMRLIGPTLLERYPEKIVNIHPSLLPSFPGKDAIGQAFRAGVKVTGVTIHYVDAGMDTGPIIAQKAVDLEEDETEESIAAKIHEVEHAIYPETLQKIQANLSRV